MLFMALCWKVDYRICFNAFLLTLFKLAHVCSLFTEQPHQQLHQGDQGNWNLKQRRQCLQQVGASFAIPLSAEPVCCGLACLSLGHCSASALCLPVAAQLRRAILWLSRHVMVCSEIRMEKSNLTLLPVEFDLQCAKYSPGLLFWAVLYWGCSI